MVYSFFCITKYFTLLKWKKIQNSLEFLNYETNFTAAFYEIPFSFSDSNKYFCYIKYFY